MVKTILFRFKNLRNIHVQQISILNCRTSISLFKYYLPKYLYLTNGSVLNYNIKWPDLLSFGYLLMRTVQAGESWPALNTYTELMISPLSKGWFIYGIHAVVYHGKVENEQFRVQKRDGEKKFRSFLCSWCWRAKKLISSNYKYY